MNDWIIKPSLIYTNGEIQPLSKEYATSLFETAIAAVQILIEDKGGASV